MRSRSLARRGIRGAARPHADAGVALGWRIVYRKGQEKVFVSIDRLAEVLPDRVTILAQVAEKAEEIDVSRAGQDPRRERLAATKTDLDHERARIAPGQCRPTSPVSRRAAPTRGARPELKRMHDLKG